MIDTRIGWLLTVLIIAMVGIVACGEEKKATEQEPEQVAKSEEQGSQPIKETDSLSTAKETIEVDMSILSSIKKGDSFTIQKADGSESFNLKVRRVQNTIPGITSISANIEDQDTGLASLLLKDGKLTGMMDLYKEQTRYRVGYDSVASAHYVQVMLREEMDVMEGSAPLTPGRDDQ